MRTLVISDLHLGAMSGAALLHGEPAREALAPEVRAADRVVLLGDVIELRDGPLLEALESARPFFEWLAETMAADAELVVVPGNHDHHLLAAWVSERRLGGEPELELEHRTRPGEPLSGLVAEIGVERVTLAYPGIWLDDGVYATHGHYLDRHLTIPTFERLGVSLVERVLGSRENGAGEVPAAAARPADYERVQAPVYDLLFALAQSGGTEGRIGGSNPSQRIWEALGGGYGRAARMRGWLMGSVALPGAVGVANRLGLGPVRADLSPGQIARAGTDAMGEVVRRLAIEATHVVYGHTHRRAPLPEEAPFEAAGTLLHNTGSWVYSPVLAGRSAAGSGFWPGTAVVVERGEAPRTIHLLDGWGADEMRSALGR